MAHRIIAEDQAERFWDPETVGKYKKIVPSADNAKMNTSELRYMWQHVQAPYKLKPDQIPWRRGTEEKSHSSQETICNRQLLAKGKISFL